MMAAQDPKNKKEAWMSRVFLLLNHGYENGPIFYGIVWKAMKERQKWSLIFCWDSFISSTKKDFC